MKVLIERRGIMELPLIKYSDIRVSEIRVIEENVLLWAKRRSSRAGIPGPPEPRQRVSRRANRTKNRLMVFSYAVIV